MESAYTYVSVATAAPVHAVREHCLTDCTEGTVLLVRAVVVEARGSRAGLTAAAHVARLVG
ncbi:hypothetical protein GCM10023221_14130 [Luteimicrobium xylanilyticum]